MLYSRVGAEPVAPEYEPSFVSFMLSRLSQDRRRCTGHLGGFATGWLVSVLAGQLTGMLVMSTNGGTMAAEQSSTFGTVLRNYREAAGLSQEQLAERAGLTASAIGALERGERRRPYPQTVQLLATALKLDEERRAALIAAVPRRGASAPAVVPMLVSDAPGSSDVPVQPPGVAHPPVPRPMDPNVGRGATAFVGRQGELVALRAKLAEAFAGQGGVVMLVGEAGIGKTRLAREFAHDAAFHGAAVLWGCCFEGDWQPPYGPWVEALGACVQARAAEDLRHELGPGASPIARLVPEVCAALPDVPLPSPLSPDDERYRLYDSIIRFVTAISAKQPVLIVLDDLHWADADSLRLLRHLARFVQKSRVLVVGAYRDPEFGLNDEHPLMGTLTVLRRENEYERIALRGFSPDEVGEYLAQTAGKPLPRTLVGVIREETSGNPFYAREVFRHLAEEGGVLQGNGQWSAGVSIKELGIPEGVRQVVGRRVARLSEQTGTLLRLAAGFTAGFGFDVLLTLSEMPEEVLLDCIDEALQAGLIRTSGHTPPGYEFAHAIVRHTLYDSLNLDRRTRLHRRIALALERVRSVGVVDDAAELAAQYHASVALPGAAQGVPHALRAAEQAMAAYAHERAAGFLRMALDLAAESPIRERAEILRQLAIAEAEAVELEHARRSVEDALEAMSAAGVAPRPRAEFLVIVARALKDGGASPTVWEPLVERGLALVGGARDLLWARLELLRNHFEQLSSGPIGGVRWLGHDPEAVAIARASGDEEDYARTLDTLDYRTREETQAVLTLARSWSRPLAVMWALDVAGRDMLYRHGAFREASAVYEELLAASERFGAIPSQGEALTHLATIQMYMGDLPQSQETLRRAHEVIALLGVGHRMHKFVPISRAVVLAYFLDGDWASLARETAEYATSAAAWHSSAGLVAAALAALGAGRAGNLTEARSLLHHITSIAERVPPTMYAHSVVVALSATAVWEVEAKEYAAAYRRLALELVQAGAGDTGFGPLQLFVARMSALLGDLAESQDYFEQARSRLDAYGITSLRAIVDYDQACSLIRAGVAERGRIVGLLDAALDAFRSHGMPAWAKSASEREKELTTGA